MPVKFRNPKQREQRITPEALDAFKRMQKSEASCTCPPGFDFVRDKRCRACEDWWTQHSVLHREMRLKPWEWPCYEHPDVECPEGYRAVEHKRAVALYRELERAAKAAKN